VTAWGKRSKVRLHSGGISPADVRLRRRGASEKGTAPGRDIRDIGPDKGPRKCRVCGKPLQAAERARCSGCISDEKLVRLVRRELARLGEPPLGVTVPAGSPWFKKRRQAEAALARLKKTAKVKRGPAISPPAGTARLPDTVCPGCFTQRPATGKCDNCG